MEARVPGVSDLFGLPYESEELECIECGIIYMNMHPTGNAGDVEETSMRDVSQDGKKSFLKAPGIVKNA